MDDLIQGIVLQSIRYGDTSLVVKIYTLQFGLQSYMVKGVRSRTARNRIAFFQPMTFLRFVQNGHPRQGGLAYLKDPELLYAFQSIPMVMNKSAILMYLAELLSHTLTQQERNEALFQFVHQSVVWLDLVEANYANFPLFFTLELSRHLGFYPQDDYSEGALFDMMEGHFTSRIPPHPYYLEKDNSALLASLLNRGLDEVASVSLTGSQRNAFLEGLLTFMRLHAPVIKALQSHDILREVLR